MNCLDKGFVNLLSSDGSDLTIVQSARVLPDAEWRGEADKRLLSYLLINKHTSPLEQVSFRFHVKAPIFVLRQWMRHRTGKFNEYSARYKELSLEYYSPENDMIGSQSDKNHQGRILDNTDRHLSLERYKGVCENAFDVYRYLLVLDWPRELARCVLPLSTYSEMVWAVDLHNLLHFIKLREDDHAQYEIQVYAKTIKELITPIVPYTMEILSVP